MQTSIHFAQKVIKLLQKLITLIMQQCKQFYLTYT